MNAPHLRVVRPGEAPAVAIPVPAAPLRTSWTADQLMTMEFPPPRWAVPGVLAEGVNLLAGPPKVGKSWLSLGLALAVAAGSRALGSIEVEAGPVLYLALEDTPRRLQSRMTKMLAGQDAPPALTLATTCPPLPEGGTAAITGWLNRNPGARMVVVDVFAKVKGRAPAGMSAYEADYAAIGHAKRLADEHAVAVVLVHHIRKAGSDDYLTEVSGTNGLAGAADATLVLKRPRGTADAVLYVTGRDVEEAEYAMQFVPAIGAWRMLDGPAEDYAVSDTRGAILRYVRAHPDSTPKAIADYTRLDPANVRKACTRMVSDGQLTADPAGRYRVPVTPGDTGSVTGVTDVTQPGLSWGNESDTPCDTVTQPGGDGAGEAR